MIMVSLKVIKKMVVCDEKFSKKSKYLQKD